MQADPKNPYTTKQGYTLDQLFHEMGSFPNGLTSEMAAQRRRRFGYNEIKEDIQRKTIRILLDQFLNPLIIVLILATLISFFLHEPTEALVISAIVAINASIGFYQEFTMEKTIAQLRQYITPTARVIRNGEVLIIPAREIVPGDLVQLALGDIIPADMYLVEAHELSANESALSGESLPVIKKAYTAIDNLSAGQREGVIYMGTYVSSGSGKGIVRATGVETAFGKVAAHIESQEPESDFQKNIRRFSRFLLKVIFGMTIFVFIINAVWGKGIFDSFLFALALAVGITPEALPIIMTITLSKAASKMAGKKVLSKSLTALEDLGSMQILCCDKTGTLTEGNLTLYDYLSLHGKTEDKILLYALLCNSHQHKKNITGFSVDEAIWQHKRASQLSARLATYKITDKNDFDFERRRMSVVIQIGDSSFKLICKGAPEAILPGCTYAANDKTPFNQKKLEEVRQKISSYEKEGYKTIAVAVKDHNKSFSEIADEVGMTLMGFLLFTDPPKTTALTAIRSLTKLGIRLKIISGDSPLITQRICKKLSVPIGKDKIITGDELEKLDENAFAAICVKHHVFARISPVQKLLIVSALRKKGYVTGFLGDGINDAAALKEADVGISVDTAAGIAKETADIILLKKSLQVLADGIKEGRRAFRNITKYVLNTVSANFGNMFTVAISSLFLPFIPLLPAQILLNNFLSDFLMLLIATDKVDESYLQQPQQWDQPFITRFMVYFGLISTSFDLLLIVLLIYVAKSSSELFRSAWFVMSLFTEVLVVFSIRTRYRFYRSKPSIALLFATLVICILTIGVVYLPIGQTLFKFEPLPVVILILIACITAMYLLVVETVKIKFYKKYQPGKPLTSL